MKDWIKAFDIKVILAFSAVYIIWGTTYLAIKIGLEEMPPFLMATFRFLIAGVLMLTYCLLKKENIFSKTLLKNMMLGAFMLLFGQGVLFWAEQYLSSGLTAVFISTLPIAYIVVDKKNWKNYFHSKMTIISIVLGLVGILILFKDQAGDSQHYSANMKIIASIVIVGSCLCWATGSLYYKTISSDSSLFCDVGWQLIGGTIACIVVSPFADNWSTFHFVDVSIKTWSAVCYLAIAGSIIAFTSSHYLLSVRPPALVGTYAYVNPVIAVLLGYFFVDEKVSPTQIAGIIVILIAAYLSNTVKLKTK